VSKQNKSRPRGDVVLPAGPLCLRMQRAVGHPIIIRRVASLEEGLELRERLLEGGEWFRVIVWRYTGSMRIEPLTTTTTEGVA
jgi:hypothetical protein